MSVSLHEGHRDRLRERYLRDGIDKLDKHTALELLLFYAIPRKDTNEIAHRLLRRFSSLRGVFDATMEQLCEVEGISRNAAAFLKFIPDVYRTALCEGVASEPFDSIDKIADMMKNYYVGVPVEVVYLVLLDNGRRLINVEKIGEGSVNAVAMDTRKLVERALYGNAARVILVHNHPNGDAIPSVQDLETTRSVAAAFHLVNIDFVEHILIAGDRYSVFSNKLPGVFMSP